MIRFNDDKIRLEMCSNRRRQKVRNGNHVGGCCWLRHSPLKNPEREFWTFSWATIRARDVLCFAVPCWRNSLLPGAVQGRKWERIVDVYPLLTIYRCTLDISICGAFDDFLFSDCWCRSWKWFVRSIFAVTDNNRRRQWGRADINAPKRTETANTPTVFIG